MDRHPERNDQRITGAATDTNEMMQSAAASPQGQKETTTFLVVTHHGCTLWISVHNFKNQYNHAVCLPGNGKAASKGSRTSQCYKVPASQVLGSVN